MRVKRFLKPSNLAPDPQDFNINQIMNDALIYEEVDYGKSVVRPKRIEVSFIHWPLSYHILKNYKHVKLTQNDSLVVHFRRFSPIEVSFF